jgi:hypothetical protein
MSDFFFVIPLKIKYYKLSRVERLFVLRPVATSTASRSSISGLTTKRLTSTLYDIIIILFGLKASLYVLIM